MAPTPSPVVVHSSNQPSRHLRYLRRRILGLSRHTPPQSSASRNEHIKPRTLNAALQGSVVPQGPPPPPINPTPSIVSEQFVTEPSTSPYSGSRPQRPSQSGDIQGNIVAAVVLIVLILGGLIGLVVGGETLRRRTRTRDERVSPTAPRCCGGRKSKPSKNRTNSPQRTKASLERMPYDEKTLPSLARPRPVFNRERRRGLSDVWPVRSLSRALFGQQTGSKHAAPGLRQPPPIASPQTTWSEFTPGSFYVAPPRTVLARIPEEREEECQSQTDSDIAVLLGITLQRTPDSGSALSTQQATEPNSMHSEGFNGPESLETAMGCGSGDGENTCEDGTRDEDTKSLGSWAPDMTSDGGESSRSSMASLESLEDEDEGESQGEEVFVLRRAQTRSVQMNKGVLLSLSLNTLGDRAMLGSPCAAAPSDGEGDVGKDYVERELTLAMLGGSFSAVDLDEFPSPPSILPMIPSLVSGFE